MTTPDPEVRALGERAGLGHWLAAHRLTDTEQPTGLRKLFRRRRLPWVGEHVHEFRDGLLLPGHTAWLPAPYATIQLCLDTVADPSGFFTDFASEPSHSATAVVGEDDWGDGRLLPPSTARIFREATRRAYEAQREPVLDRIRSGETVAFEALEVSATAFTSDREDEPVAWTRITGWQFLPTGKEIEVSVDHQAPTTWAEVGDVANLPLALEAIRYAQQLAGGDRR